jgi:hypothetical protein
MIMKEYLNSSSSQKASATSKQVYIQIPNYSINQLQVALVWWQNPAVRTKVELGVAGFVVEQVTVPAFEQD